MSKWIRRIGAAAAGGAVLLSAACGGGNAQRTPSPVATTNTTPAPAATSPTTALPATPTVSAAATSTVPAAAPTPTAAQSLPATPAPPAPVPTPVPPTAAPPAAQSITIVAKDVKFSPTTFTVSVGSPLNITLDNQDAGVAHDIVIFDPSGNRVAGTDVATGPVQQHVSFTPTVPGRYAFKCTVHPQQMNGALSAG